MPTGLDRRRRPAPAPGPGVPRSTPACAGSRRNWPRSTPAGRYCHRGAGACRPRTGGRRRCRWPAMPPVSGQAGQTSAAHPADACHRTARPRARRTGTPGRGPTRSRAPRRPGCRSRAPQTSRPAPRHARCATPPMRHAALLRPPRRPATPGAARSPAPCSGHPAGPVPGGSSRHAAPRSTHAARPRCRHRAVRRCSRPAWPRGPGRRRTCAGRAIRPATAGARPAVPPAAHCAPMHRPSAAMRVAVRRAGPGNWRGAGWC